MVDFNFLISSFAKAKVLQRYAIPNFHQRLKINDALCELS